MKKSVKIGLGILGVGVVSGLLFWSGIGGKLLQTNLIGFGNYNYEVEFELPGYVFPEERERPLNPDGSGAFMPRVTEPDLICFDYLGGDQGCFSITDTANLRYSYMSAGGKKVVVIGKDGFLEETRFYDFEIELPENEPELTFERADNFVEKYKFNLSEAGGLGKWSWNFGEGEGWERGEAEMEHEFEEKGYYLVEAKKELEVMEKGGTNANEAVVNWGMSDTFLIDLENNGTGTEKVTTKRKPFYFVEIDEDDSIPENPPMISMEWEPGQNVIVGQEVKFDADETVDGEGETGDLEFSWTWDQRTAQFNEWSSKKSGDHVYDEPGVYNFVLRVRDRSGQSDVTVARIHVHDPYHNQSYFTVEPEEGFTDQVFTFEPTAWDDLQTPREDFQVRWDFDGDGEWDTSEMDLQPVQIYYDAGSYLPIMLMINDNNGIETKVKGYYRQINKPNEGRIMVNKHEKDSLNAAFEIKPNEGSTYTVFTFDAGDTLPVGTNYDMLQSSDWAFRWDFNGDGVMDTDWERYPIAKYQFAKDDTYRTILEVAKGGYSDFASRKVVVEKLYHPEARFVANPAGGSESIRHWEFDATSSIDPEDGDGLMYRWDFDMDGLWDTEWEKAKKAYHQYPTVGHFKVMLEVRDKNWFTNRTEGEVSVYNNTDPIAGFTVDVMRGSRAHEFEFDVSSSSDRHTAFPEMKGRWDWDGDGVWDTELESLGQRIFRHKYDEVGSKEVTLEVRDWEGFPTVAKQKIWVTENMGPTVSLKVNPVRGFFSTEFVGRVEAWDEESEGTKLKYNFDWDWKQGDINQTAEKGGSNSEGTHKYGEGGWHTIRVEVMDEENMMGADVVEIYVHPLSMYIDWLIKVGGTMYESYDGFKPNDYVSRAELLRMMYEAFAPERLPFQPVQVERRETGGEWISDVKIGVNRTQGREYELQAPVSEEIISYTWDVEGDGTWDLKKSGENEVTHTYLRYGIYNVIVDLEMQNGQYKRLTQRVEVGLDEGGASAETEISDPAKEERELVKIPFADVTHDDWFAPYIVAAFQDGVMDGFRDRHFRPNEPVSVVGALKAVLRMYSLEAGVVVKRTFADVGNGKWFAPLASFAVENGMWGTDEEGNFNPSQAVTRGESARMLFEADRLSSENEE